MHAVDPLAQRRAGEHRRPGTDEALEVQLAAAELVEHADRAGRRIGERDPGEERGQLASVPGVRGEMWTNTVLVSWAAWQPLHVLSAK